MKRLISVLLVIFLLLLFGCKKAPEEEISLKEPVTEKIGTVTVERGDLRDTTVLDAFIVPEEVELSLPISGIVDEMPFMTGDRAEKGDLLLKLDTFKVEQEIAALQAELEDLDVQASFEQRIYELDMAYQDRLIAGYQQQGAGWQSVRLAQLDKEDLSLTHSEYLREYERQKSEKAEKLAEKQEIYDSSFLYAPVSGIVYYVNSGYQNGVSMIITEGARTEKDQTLVYIADETRKHIDLEDRITAELRGLPCFALYQGEEVEIEAITLSSEQRIRDSVLVRKDAHRYRILHRTMTDMKPGDYIPVYFVKESYEDVLYVPLSAVYHDSELSEDYVYRMDSDGGHERVAVECRQCGVYMVIQSGLSEGDELYVVR